MDLEVYLSDSQKFIVCRAPKQITEEVTRHMTAAIAKLTETTGVVNRLIDVRDARNVMSVATNYDMAYKTMEAMQLDRSTKVAILHHPTDTSHEFVCTAARNAGFNLRTFTDEAAATVWLDDDDGYRN